jgi:hypothetical protein
VECQFPRCPNKAQEEPVPNLVNVPDNGSPDEPVFLCREHHQQFVESPHAFLIAFQADA